MNIFSNGNDLNGHCSYDTTLNASVDVVSSSLKHCAVIPKLQPLTQDWQFESPGEFLLSVWFNLLKSRVFSLSYE